MDATGRTKVRSPGFGPDSLTPQERQIALLAASGLSNKRIAERLLLSHRTVGAHLRNIFPKLGIQRRASLRDALTVDLRAPGPAASPALFADAVSLKPDELEIATLAASGLSNKEIAGRVHLSHRTVGARLYRIFPKLGVTSRAALRDALRAAGSSTPR